MKLYIVKKPDFINQKLYSKLISRISIKRKIKINNFFYMDDKYRGLIAEMLTFIKIPQIAGAKIDEIQFDENQYGKPFVKKYPNLYFNISHSGDWIGNCFDNKPIGLDIEKVKAIDLEVAKEYFTNAEYLELLSKKGHKRLNYFYELWTCKESYIKAIGKGFFQELNTFCTSEFTIDARIKKT